MSHAIVRFAPAGKPASTRVSRLAMVAAVLVAMVAFGATMFGGNSPGVAPPQVWTSMPDTGVQQGAVSSTDPSVPQASAVFFHQQPATEEDVSTF